MARLVVAPAACICRTMGRRLAAKAFAATPVRLGTSSHYPNALTRWEKARCKSFIRLASHSCWRGQSAWSSGSASIRQLDTRHSCASGSSSNPADSQVPFRLHLLAFQQTEKFLRSCTQDRQLRSHLLFGADHHDCDGKPIDASPASITGGEFYPGADVVVSVIADPVISPIDRCKRLSANTPMIKGVSYAIERRRSADAGL
jgi:hypothetical protein